jgi:hypothetical protein
MSFASRDPDFTILADGERLETLRLDRLYADWRRAAPPGGLPGAAFLQQPRDYLEGADILLEVEPGEPAPRFRYRHIGARITAVSGRDLTGAYVDEHPERFFADVAGRVCALVVQARRPIHARLYREIDGRNYVVEYLMVPVGDAAGAVAQILAAQLYRAETP